MNKPLYPGHHDNSWPTTTPAMKLATTLIDLTPEERTRCISALDSELKMKVLEELYKLGKK